MSELGDFRAEKDEFFRQHPRSLLTPEQRATFEGLAYYPENDALVIRETLQREGVDLDEAIVMQTTTGGTQSYRRAGVGPVLGRRRSGTAHAVHLLGRARAVPPVP